MSLKFTILEISLIYLIFIFIDCFTVFHVFMKITLINYTIRLGQYTSTLFFAIVELSLIDMIIFEVSQFAHAMELVIFELTLILCNTF